MKTRLAFTFVFLYLLFLGALAVPYAFQNILLYSLFFTLPTVVGIWFIWNIEMSFNVRSRQHEAEKPIVHQRRNNRENNTEKRKRDTLDHVLRDLSDEQLDVLRQRLNDNTIDDEVLHERIVGADGELIRRK